MLQISNMCLHSVLTMFEQYLVRLRNSFIFEVVLSLTLTFKFELNSC